MLVGDAGRCSAWRCIVAHAGRRRRRRSRSALLLGVLFIAAGAGRLYVDARTAPRARGERAGRRALPMLAPRPRLAGAVRDRLHGGRQRRSTSRSASSPTTRSASRRSSSSSPALFFVLAAMTYVEGASLHQERGGSTVFARYALQRAVELRRRLGDPARLRDPDRGHARSSATNYLAAFWSDARRRARRSSSSRCGDHRLRRGRATSAASRTTRVDRVRAARARRHRAAAADRSCSAWRCSSTPTRSPTRSTSATTPTWSDVIFALGVATVVVHRPGVRRRASPGEVDVAARGLQAADRQRDARA